MCHDQNLIDWLIYQTIVKNHDLCVVITKETLIIGATRVSTDEMKEIHIQISYT